MALSDYIPNVFGQAAPSYLGGLLGAEETQNLQNRANVQGLLGAGLALAQGMSRTGPRRSAAENILGALGGGFGAAGGAYEQGVKNYVTQQQIAQTQLAQGQAVRKMRSIESAKAKYPDLAPLFDIDAGKAMEQVILRENAKAYGLGADFTQDSTQGSAERPVISDASVTAIAPVVASNSAASVSSNQQPVVSLVNPANVAKANDYRRKATLAISRGDDKTAKFFQDEADRLDPKETFMFRDGKLISSKKGLVIDYGGTKLLSEEDVIKNRLDPNKRYQISNAGNITEIPTTAKTRLLTSKEAEAERLPTDQGEVYQISADNTISQVQGTNRGTQLNKASLIASLPSQGKNIYTTLKPRFKALEERVNGLTAEQINSELQAILSENAKILQELDPTLFQQDIKRKTAGAPKNYFNLNDPVKKAQALSQNLTNYVQNKNVSESFEVANRFNNFVSAYNNPAARGASDAFLIYSVAKILDPGGAVQQGDIETIAGKKSIPEQLRGIHEKFLSTRTLSDEQREDLNTLAYSAMNNKRNSLKPTIKQYRNYATSFESPDPTVDIQDPFDSIKLPKDRIVTINGKRTIVRLGKDRDGVQGYYYTAPNGKTYPYQD